MEEADLTEALSLITENGYYFWRCNPLLNTGPKLLTTEGRCQYRTLAGVNLSPNQRSPGIVNTNLQALMTALEIDPQTVRELSKFTESK